MKLLDYEGVIRIEAYIFLRKMLKHENKPEIVVDKAPWYPWALQRLGLKYRNETFGERNTVETFFSKLKELKDSEIYSHSIALSIQS